MFDQLGDTSSTGTLQASSAQRALRRAAALLEKMGCCSRGPWSAFPWSWRPPRSSTGKTKVVGLVELSMPAPLDYADYDGITSYHLALCDPPTGGPTYCRPLSGCRLPEVGRRAGGRLRAGAPLQPASWPYRLSSLLSKLFPFIRAAAVGRSRPAESSTSLFDRLGVTSSTGTSQVSSAPRIPCRAAALLEKNSGFWSCGFVIGPLFSPSTAAPSIHRLALHAGQ